ncbi:hypothetical protein ZIOFF_013187 [Zingiber officinale]|uniref:BHLH domain-containing protein n=1 Tax=Zingiber officinale TaxID=94328 RepID=A0A8J5HFJ8_ZINOF|nr:hypothetical protein ZIOFF_013187 [Zingiber officinale]
MRLARSPKQAQGSESEPNGQSATHISSLRLPIDAHSEAKQDAESNAINTRSARFCKNEREGSSAPRWKKTEEAAEGWASWSCLLRGKASCSSTALLLLRRSKIAGKRLSTSIMTPKTECPASATSSFHGGTKVPFIYMRILATSIIKQICESQRRKEKLGDRITALQQLVSPFGKSDAASVLHEALGYIRFLHDQVQVLSSPYLRNSQFVEEIAAEEEEARRIDDLRSWGLCLVPVSCAELVTSSNGADFWSPAMATTTGGSKSSSSISKH